MADLLKTLRLQKGLTQKEVASILGYSEQLISFWEKGNSFPDASVWGALCQLYDVSLSALLHDDLTISGAKVSKTFDVNEFALRLLTLRRDKGLTQERAASSLGVNVKTIISFEKGKSLPSRKIFLALCSLYNTREEELYFGITVHVAEENKSEDFVAKVPAKTPRFRRVLLFSSMAVIATGAITLGIIFFPKQNDGNRIDGDENLAQASDVYQSSGQTPSSIISSRSDFILEDYVPPFDPNVISNYCYGDQVNAHILDENGNELFMTPLTYGQVPRFDFYMDNRVDAHDSFAYIFQRFDGDYSPCYEDRSFTVAYKTIPLEDYLSSPYEFCFTEDGEGLCLYKYKGEVSETFEIPGSIVGYPVRVLNFLLFEDQTIKSLIVPDTVTRIKNPIIAGSMALKQVRLSQNLERVDNYIVPSCPNLSYLNDGNTQYLGNESNPYLYCANAEACDGEIRFHSDCRIINRILDYVPFTKITLPQSLRYLTPTAIPDLQRSPTIFVEEGCACFRKEEGCLIDNRDHSLIAVDEGTASLPEGIKSIKENALCHFNADTLKLPSSVISIEGILSKQKLPITKVEIGPCLSAIDYEAFRNCVNVERFIVDAGNEVYESSDGCLYTKGRKRLLSCPSATPMNEYIAMEETSILGRLSFSENQNITHVQLFPEQHDIPLCLGNNTFSSCPNLTNVEINANLISSSAFYDCPMLERVVLGKGVMTIMPCAFDGCLNLKSIYYAGNKEQWQQVDVDINAFYPNQPNVIFME